jgi:hypothetical protein
MSVIDNSPARDKCSGFIFNQPVTIAASSFPKECVQRWNQSPAYIKDADIYPAIPVVINMFRLPDLLTGENTASCRLKSLQT